VDVAFEVGDIRALPYRRRFDVVTWIEISFFDEDMVRAAYSYLKPGGAFVFDARNPENPRAKGRSGDWSAWREENGVFHLESHETDAASGLRRDAWIEIDTVNDLITEHPAVWEPVRLREKLEMLRRNGFTRVELRTLDGESFCHGEEPYWLWAVGRRSWLRPAAVSAGSRGESLPRV